MAFRLNCDVGTMERVRRENTQDNTGKVTERLGGTIN
jgi:hypothetical protein